MPTLLSFALDLEAIRFFEEVARRRSFSAAAAALGTSQPRVSQVIAQLERQIGRRLFVRSTRRVDLTEAARALQVYAAALRQIETELRRDLALSERREELRIGLVPDFATGGLQRALGLFAERHREIALEVQIGASSALRRRVRAGELHVAVTRSLSPAEETDIGPFNLGPSDLGRCELVWAGQPWLAALSGPVPLVIDPEPSETRAATLDALRRAGRPWRVVAQSECFASRCAALGAGLGIAALPVRLLPGGLSVLGGGLPKLGAIVYELDMADPPHPAGLDSLAGILGTVVAEVLGP